MDYHPPNHDTIFSWFVANKLTIWNDTILLKYRATVGVDVVNFKFQMEKKAISISREGRINRLTVVNVNVYHTEFNISFMYIQQIWINLDFAL